MKETFKIEPIENLALQKILDNHPTDYKFEVEVFYGKPTFLGGPPTVYAIPGKIKGFEKSFDLSKEEFSWIRLGDYMKSFSFNGVKYNMCVGIREISWNDAKEEYSIDLVFS